MRSGLIRVSKPGIDVNSTREADLLLSLGARNLQAIQSGAVSVAPSSATGLETVYNFTIGFPPQQTVPDAFVAIIDKNNAISSRFVVAPPTYTLTFSTSSLAVNVHVPAPDPINGLAYVIYRKRVDS